MNGMQISSPTTELAGLTARALARQATVKRTPKALTPEAGTRLAIRAWRKWFPLFVEKAKLHQQRSEIYEAHGFENFAPEIYLKPNSGSFCKFAFNDRENLAGWIAKKLNRRTKKGAAEADRLLRDWKNSSRRAARLREKTCIDSIESRFLAASLRLAAVEDGNWRLPSSAASAAIIAFVGLSKSLDVDPKWRQLGLIDSGAWWQIETLKRLTPALPDEIAGPLTAVIVMAERDPNVKTCRALYEAANYTPPKTPRASQAARSKKAATKQ
jgi:hypothetical protein